MKFDTILVCVIVTLAGCFGDLRAQSVSRDSADGYFKRLVDADEVNKSTLDTLFKYNIGSQTAFFRYLTKHSEEVDSAYNKVGIADDYITFILYKEQVVPVMLKAKNAEHDISRKDWKKLKRSIAHQYPSHAAKVVATGKVQWAEQQKDTSDMIKATIHYYDQYGFDTSNYMERIGVNNFCYDVVFKTSNRKKELLKASHYMELLLQADPLNALSMDTYANLLYKAGRARQAISLQRKAVSLANDMEEISRNLALMESGQPTWP